MTGSSRSEDAGGVPSAGLMVGIRSSGRQEPFRTITWLAQHLRPRGPASAPVGPLQHASCRTGFGQRIVSQPAIDWPAVRATPKGCHSALARLTAVQQHSPEAEKGVQGKQSARSAPLATRLDLRGRFSVAWSGDARAYEGRGNRLGPRPAARARWSCTRRSRRSCARPGRTRRC